MPIEISEQDSLAAQFFVSPQAMAYPIGDDNYTIVRSGIVQLPNESKIDAQNADRPWRPDGFRGTSESQWRGDRLILNLDPEPSISRLNLPLPGPSAAEFWVFVMDQGIPFASLNSIYNGAVSNYAGSSVNTFAIHQPAPRDGYFNFEMDIAVRDTDGFYVALVGHMVLEKAA